MREGDDDEDEVAKADEGDSGEMKLCLGWDDDEALSIDHRSASPLPPSSPITFALSFTTTLNLSSPSLLAVVVMVVVVVVVMVVVMMVDLPVTISFFDT